MYVSYNKDINFFIQYLKIYLKNLINKSILKKLIIWARYLIYTS